MNLYVSIGRSWASTCEDDLPEILTHIVSANSLKLLVSSIALCNICKVGGLILENDEIWYE